MANLTEGMLIEKLTDESIRLERSRLQGIREAFDFGFQIVVMYDGKQFARTIDEYLRNIDMTRGEHREFIAERLKQASTRSG